MAGDSQAAEQEGAPPAMFTDALILTFGISLVGILLVLLGAIMDNRK